MEMCEIPRITKEADNFFRSFSNLTPFTQVMRRTNMVFAERGMSQQSLQISEGIEDAAQPYGGEDGCS